MKYLALLWAGLWRRPLRTVFTFLSIVMAFLLFGLLQGFNSGLAASAQNLHADRLFVSNRLNPVQGLRYPQRAEIVKLPAVSEVAANVSFGGSYQDPKNQVPGIAVEIAPFFAIYDEAKPSAGALEAMAKTPDGVIVGAATMAKYGWKVGDKLPLHTSIWFQQATGSKDWVFEIVGTYNIPENPERAVLMLANWEYQQNSVQVTGRGRINGMAIKLTSANEAAATTRAIDDLFVNSPTPTRSLSEQEIGQNQIRALGDLGFIARSVVSAVFFTLLVLTGTTLLQQVRERRGELAVLKTLGFTDGQVGALIIAEAALLCVSAAILGLLAASLVFPLVGTMLGPVVKMPAGVIVSGLFAALLVAVVAGWVPAWHARRLAIVDALAGR